MDVGLVARLTVLLAVSALVAWLLAVVVAVSAGSLAAAVVLRTVLTLLVALLVTRLVVRRSTQRPALWVSVAVAAVASYVLSPVSWSGRALLAQAVLEPGLLTFGLDLVVWVAVVVLAARTVEPRPAAREYGAAPTWR